MNTSLGRLSENVFYDSASVLAWPDLNETLFLERVMAHLRVVMEKSFRDHKFFILSAFNGDIEPRSASDRSPRKVLIFISDESGSVPTALEEHYLAIFKCYLPCEMPGTNLFPFNLGYVRDVHTLPTKPVEDRGISVFFSGNLNANRLPLYRALHPVYRRLPQAAFRVALSLAARGIAPWLMPKHLDSALPNAEVHFTDGFGKGLSGADYGERLTDSRIVLCPKGWQSAETFRHFEAMRAGAVVVSEPLPDTHFYRNAPIVTVDNWATGIARVRALLSDKVAVRRYHLATLDWWQNVCSEAATARYMAEKIREAAS